MRNLVGSSVDHYQILVKIRETPTRILYRAYNTKAQNYTALEMVKMSGPEPSVLLGLINDQTRKTAELVHPNIANVTDTGLYEGLVYIVYNFSPTQPVRRFFNRTFPWREMARELVSITHALAYAHEKGIVHGALHPSSIVLDEKRNPILFDFGFEQILTNYILANSPGAWINRWGFEYRAPEQLDGAMPDARSDIYAIGMMMHEWLIGKIALLDSTVLGTLQMRKRALEPIDKTSTLPPVVQNLIRKCIALHPTDRYQSMQEIYIILARGALDMGITRKMVRKPLDIPRQRFNTRRLVTRFGIVGMLALVAITVMNLPGLSTKGPPIVSSTQPTIFETQLRPTGTVVKPTVSPTREMVASETPRPEVLTFPVFQNTPFSSSVRQTLQPGNTNRMVMLGLWGIGDLNRLVSAPGGNRVAAASSMGIFIFEAQSLELEKYIDTRSWVTAIHFSPDGKTLATGDRDGLIQLWDTETWQESQAPYSGHTKAILDLAFSPDGTKLASVSLDNLLIQWNVKSTEDQTLERAEIPGGLSAVAYSADSQRIVTAGNNFQISVWDAESFSVLQTKAFSSKVVDIVSVKESNVFVIGGTNQQVAIFDIDRGANFIQVGSLQYPLTGVAASPDGKLIGAGDINGGITVWNTSGEEFSELWATKNFTSGDPSDLDVPGSPHSLVLSSDGKSIFSGLHNGTIRRLDANTGTEARSNQSLNAHIKKMVVSRNSQYLATQHDNNLITVWDLGKGTPLFQLQGEIKDGDPFSQNDRMLAIAADSETIKVYDPANGDEIHTFHGDRNPIAIKFIKEDAQLVAVSDRSTRLWSMTSGEELKTTVRFEGTGCSTIYDVNEDPVISITNYYHVIDDQQNRLGLCNFDPLNWAFAINEAQGLIAYGGSSKLAVINMQSADNKAQDMLGVNRKNIVRVALGPDGTLLAAAFEDNTIHIWDIATREELSNLYGHSNSIIHLRFTPDGKLLISSSLDGTIRLWGVPY